MYTKHIISVQENSAVPLRHHNKRDIVSIGGYSRERELMERLMKFYFDVEFDEPTSWPQSNKCRYDFPCTWKAYKDAIDRMREDGIQVGLTTTHGRLMS